MLVCIDGSDASMRATREAARLTAHGHGRLRLLHLINSPTIGVEFDRGRFYLRDILLQMRQSTEEEMNRALSLARAEGATIDCVQIVERAASLAVVVREQADAWLADLIVIGAHPRSGWQRLWEGSRSEQVARTAAVPVLLVGATPGHLPVAVQSPAMPSPVVRAE